MHYFKLIVVHPIYCKYLHVYQCAQNSPADQDVTVIDVFQFQWAQDFFLHFYSWDFDLIHLIFWFVFTAACLWLSDIKVDQNLFEIS